MTQNTLSTPIFSRRTFPEPSPDVCATFFTCLGNGVAGVADLTHTYPAAVRFFDGQRHGGAALRYELVWLDNGGAPSVVDEFVARSVAHQCCASSPDCPQDSTTDNVTATATGNSTFGGACDRCRKTTANNANESKQPCSTLRRPTFATGQLPRMQANQSSRVQP